MHAGGKNAVRALSRQTQAPGVPAGRPAGPPFPEAISHRRIDRPCLTDPRDVAVSSAARHFTWRREPAEPATRVSVCGAQALDREAAQKILRAAHAIARGGAPIIERLEILARARPPLDPPPPRSIAVRERRLQLAKRASASPPSRRRQGALQRCAHPRRAFEPKGAADGRDVLVEALADLRHVEERSVAEFRHPHSFDEFARPTILLLVGEEELLERQLAPLALCAAASRSRRAR